MYVNDLGISPDSDYYIYSPSLLAKKLYLYPLSTGHFLYDGDYLLERNQFDSFLLMYIVKGSCTISLDTHQFIAKSGEFVLLDCYAPHSYGSPKPWEAFWLHFDGKLARSFFEEITSRNGYAFIPSNTSSAFFYLEKVYNLFRFSSTLSESSISASLTELLNCLLQPAEKPIDLYHATLITDTIAHINQYFHTPLSIKDLAQKANLSLYHFIRVFTKETGLTPYQYLVNTRIAAAKFLLKTSDVPVKDIAFRTGFHSESSFCTCFKKMEHLTPSTYRNNM